MSPNPLLRPLAVVGGLGVLAMGAVVEFPPPQGARAEVEVTKVEAAEPDEVVAPTVPKTPDLVPRNAQGALAGLVVYLSAGHGYVAHERGRGWQRPTIHGLQEDTYTARFVGDELIPALERAGAVVLTPRERDRNPLLVFADDASERFVAEGALGPEMAGPWSMAQPSAALADATASGTAIAPGGSAAWTLTAPTDGVYQLYASWIANSGRDKSARYTVLHGDGPEALTVDQTAHGDTWWPLARLDLTRGEQITVVLEGSGEGTLSANTIRMGGGSALVADRRSGERVVMPAWQVASIHHLPMLGAPAAVWAAPGGGFAGDAAARARWADWASPEGEDAVYLSIHTDAGGGRGTTALVRRKCQRKGSCDSLVRRSQDLADRLRETYVDTVRQIDPSWLDRGTKTKALAEVSHHMNPRIPAALLELGFHDNLADARMLGRSDFVRGAADSLVAGLIRWRADSPDLLPPSAPDRSSWEGRWVGWHAGEAGVAHGTSDRWRIRTRTSGIWSAPRWVTGTRAQVTAATEAVEITGSNEAGLGRPLIIDRGGVTSR